MIEQTDLLGRLERVEKSRGGWTARCPAHDHQESSLFIWHEDGVRWRLECCVEPARRDLGYDHPIAELRTALGDRRLRRRCEHGEGR